MNVFDQILNISYKKGMGITGITDEFFCALVSKLNKTRNILIVVNSLYEANKIYTSLTNYADKVYLFPMDDFLTSEAIAMSPDLEITRLETLNNITNNNQGIIVTNLMGYLRYLPNQKQFKDSIISIEVGKEIAPKKLVENLISIGYKIESIVTKTGELGIRGYVLDVFPLGEENPVRIEFFGDEIDSIRFFDSNTQKSIKNVSSIKINPITEFLTTIEVEDQFKKQKYLPKYLNTTVNITSYIQEPIVIYKDYSQLKLSYQQIMEDCFSFNTTKDTNFKGKYMYDLEECLTKDYFYYLSVNNTSNKIQPGLLKDYHVRTINNFKENISVINDFLVNSIRNNKTVIICLPKNKISRVVKTLNYLNGLL